MPKDTVADEERVTKALTEVVTTLEQQAGALRSALNEQGDVGELLNALRLAESSISRSIERFGDHLLEGASLSDARWLRLEYERLRALSWLLEEKRPNPRVSKGWSG